MDVAQGRRRDVRRGRRATTSTWDAQSRLTVAPITQTEQGTTGSRERHKSGNSGCRREMAVSEARGIGSRRAGRQDVRARRVDEMPALRRSGEVQLVRPVVGPSVAGGGSNDTTGSPDWSVP